MELTTSARVDVSSITVGGTAMTKLDDVGGGGFETITSWHLPTGKAAGTYTVVVTLSGDIGGAGPPNVTVPFWQITGANSTPFDHNASSAASNVTLNTAANGFAIFGVLGNSNPTAFSSATTRTGPTSGFIYKMAGDLATSSQTPHTESTTGTSDYVFEGISWQVGVIVYTFSLGTGVYTYTGAALTAAIHRLFSLGTGVYAYTGSALTFTKVKLFALGTGSYAYTGKAMTFVRHLVFSLGTGAYTYTGKILSFISGLRNLAVGTFTGPPADTGEETTSLFSVRGVGSTVVPKRSPPPTPKD